MSYWDLQETLNTGVLITCFIHVSSIYAYPVIKWIKITCNSIIGQNWDAAFSYFSFSLPFFFFSPFLLSHCSSIYRGRKTTVLWKSKWSISVPLLMRWVCLLIPNATKANQVSSPQSKHSFCREQQAQIWNNLELIGSLQIQNNTHTENVEYCANCAMSWCTSVFWVYDQISDVHKCYLFWCRYEEKKDWNSHWNNIWGMPKPNSIL